MTNSKKVSIFGSTDFFLTKSLDIEDHKTAGRIDRSTLTSIFFLVVLTKTCSMV